jgi:4-alpha-glucanotransferase
MPLDAKKQFQHPSEYSYLTVCTPSTHDCSTLRGWWEENRAHTAAFWKFLGMNGMNRIMNGMNSMNGIRYEWYNEWYKI